ELNQQKKKISELNELMENFKKHITQLESEKAGSTAHIETLENQLQQLNSQVAQLCSEKEILQNQLSTSTSEKSKQSKEIENLQNALAETNELARSLTDQVEVSKVNNRQLNDSFHKWQDES